MSIAEQVSKLKSLREAGALSEAEYSAEKAKVLSSTGSLGSGGALTKRGPLPAAVAVASIFILAIISTKIRLVSFLFDPLFTFFYSPNSRNIILELIAFAVIFSLFAFLNVSSTRKVSSILLVAFAASCAILICETFVFLSLILGTEGGFFFDLLIRTVFTFVLITVVGLVVDFAFSKRYYR